jgi:hypothetical protein
MRSAVVLLLLLATPSPARALDFTAILHTADGTIAEDCAHIADGKCDKTVPLTLGRLAAAALSQPSKAQTAEQVIDGDLARRVIGAKDMELSPEEIVKIKQKLGDLGYNAAVVAEAVHAIDPSMAEKR